MTLNVTVTGLILSQITPSYSIILMIHFNIIVRHSVSKASKWSLSFGF